MKFLLFNILAIGILANVAMAAGYLQEKNEHFGSWLVAVLFSLGCLFYARVNHKMWSEQEESDNNL